METDRQYSQQVRRHIACSKAEMTSERAIAHEDIAVAAAMNAEDRITALALERDALAAQLAGCRRVLEWLREMGAVVRSDPRPGVPYPYWVEMAVYIGGKQATTKFYERLSVATGVPLADLDPTGEGEHPKPLETSANQRETGALSYSDLADRPGEMAARAECADGVSVRGGDGK
jgi:hypothetical protein